MMRGRKKNRDVRDAPIVFHPAGCNRYFIASLTYRSVTATE